MKLFMMDQQIKHMTIRKTILKTFYSSTDKDITFVLDRETRNPVCSYVLIQTEHPKLLIFETRPGNSFLENKHLEVQNMDIFTYVNSKFICVKRTHTD